MSTLSNANIQAAADALFQAEATRQQVSPITQAHPDMDMDDAYAVQSAWVNKKIAAGDKVIGYKIGLTSRVMQRTMKIDTPDFGVLLESMYFDNNCSIRAADFPDPRIEVELAFVLKKRLFGDNLTIDDVLEATDYIVPSLELIAARSFRVDPHTGYTRTVMDTISDNAANAGIIVGDNRFEPHEIDLRWSGALLYRNGVVEETGLAAGVLDHPANGICWVGKRFAPHGIALEPGQIILSGSFTAPVIANAGDVFRADYGPLGEINCTFI
ncbi:2-oxo-hepta-3-ene-1,7-dioic acid hydratase [Pseudomaricurvus alcaniphilus]|uniref:2-oxo-hept-4-ene-1,7-dioate hydratase n=1 Tax=Pseudomaricurvus alcaniphilus TaxID=1166482 RepID=UPI00140C3B52|nr:2-oxo-hepta-3-ene-1,7-dioic acid hydratase [Pseudomaricurvus alcaniphilus]NHN39879.1 2-oxo-hepta-3-ene-1,7-dioic acid hydratase [Pseudomaricurvus alcaniphilus]